MVVLLDANVVLNHITGREDPYLQASQEIMSLCGHNKWMAISHSILYLSFGTP